MEIIIHCDECNKNVCIEVDNIDYDSTDGMCDIDYTCPECGADGTFTLNV